MSARLVPHAILAALTLASAAHAADFTVAVDVRESARGILHVHETFAAHAGAMAISYPEWLPGEHGPTGPNTDIAGLFVKAGARTLAWRRDPVDMYTIRFDVPAGATAVDVSFDFLIDRSTAGFTSGACGTENLLLLSWNQVTMGPAGKPSDAVTCEASLTLPAGWRYATALESRAQGGGLVRFEPCSFTTLVDSPVLAGRYFRSVEIGTDPAVPERLDMACDSEAGLAIPADQVAALRKLMRESRALFGARHYRHYDFLLSMSEHIAHFGLEHHQSSDDRVHERIWRDDDTRRSHSNLLAHELVHSWNGKFRRPAGLATGDFSTPMQGELLWVYEGLTQYLGFVLGARSGIRTPAEARERLAAVAAELESNRGRTWRPVADTGTEAQLLYEARGAWEHYRRGTDFYDEGLLVWLEADVTIRRLSNGARSLDDFCKRFHGGPENGPELKTYTVDDVFAALEAVQPFDWRAFFHDRMDVPTLHAPTGGIEQGGWRVAWADSMGALAKASESVGERVDETHSIGVSLDKKSGLVQDVVPGSAADQAGVAPDMTLLGVNGRHWSKDVLRDALTDTKRSGSLELLLENSEFFRTAKLAYRDGRRYPALARTTGRDWVSEILAPHTP